METGALPLSNLILKGEIYMAKFKLGQLVATRGVDDLMQKDRIFAAWIITEWDRSVTTILFPEEY